MTTNIAYWGPGSDDPALAEFRMRLRDEWLRRGYGWVDDENPADAEVVFNFINPDKPKPFRRRQRWISCPTLEATRTSHGSHGSFVFAGGRCQARTNVSCTTSSASAALPVMR